MRTAVISDLHAYAPALRAVLQDAADAGVARIICLGDVLGYGPDPHETLKLVHARVHVCLAGNHDDAVCGRLPTDDFGDFAARMVARHRAALGPEALAWLKSLSYVYEGPGFACAHGDFTDPAWFNYVLDESDAAPSWAVRNEQLLFVGHTHEPGLFVVGASGRPHKLAPVDFILEEGKRYLINPGSVGYPRAENGRSSYVIYDDADRSVEFRTLPFDLETYRLRMEGKGLEEAPWMRARERAAHTPRLRVERPFAAAPCASPKRRWLLRILLAAALLGLGLGVGFLFASFHSAPHTGGKLKRAAEDVGPYQSNPQPPVSSVGRGGYPPPPATQKLDNAQLENFSGLSLLATIPLEKDAKSFPFSISRKDAGTDPVSVRLEFRDAHDNSLKVQSYKFGKRTQSWRPRIPPSAARAVLFVPPHLTPPPVITPQANR